MVCGGEQVLVSFLKILRQGRVPIFPKVVKVNCPTGSSSVTDVAMELFPDGVTGDAGPAESQILVTWDSTPLLVVLVNPIRDTEYSLPVGVSVDGW